MESPGRQLRDALSKTVAIAGSVSTTAAAVKAEREATPVTGVPANMEVPNAGGNPGQADIQ